MTDKSQVLGGLIMLIIGVVIAPLVFIYQIDEIWLVVSIVWIFWGILNLFDGLTCKVF
jgi:hypothetical protein